MTFDLYNDKLPLYNDVHSKTTAWVTFVTSTLVDATFRGYPCTTCWENVVQQYTMSFDLPKKYLCVEVLAQMNDN